MSETKAAVDRLRELCEEALLRTREETHPDFTFGLEPIENEIVSITKWLSSNCSEFRSLSASPFVLARSAEVYNYVKEIDGKRAVVVGFKDCCLLDPYPDHGLQFRVWEDTADSEYEIAREYFPDWEPLFAQYTPKYQPDFLRSTVYQYLERWVRFLTAASEKLGTSSTAAAASPQTGPEVEKQSSTPAVGKAAEQTKPEVHTVTVDSICEKLRSTTEGRRTLRVILTLTKDGKSPAEISRRNGSRRGFSLSNISESLAKVRKQFPGFLSE